MKRHIALFAILLLLLSGCWSRIEVNDLAIVSMLGLDRTTDGELEVWTNVVVPAEAGGGRGDGGAGSQDGRSFITLRGTGRTVMEGAKRIQTELPRRLFWAHARVILISEELARSGVRPVLDFLTRHRELRLTNYVLVVRGSLGETMATQTDLEKLPVESVREISRLRIGTATTVGQLAQNMAAYGVEPAMGVVEISPPPPEAPAGQQPALRLTGTALFRDDKLVGFLDEKLTRGLLWLQGEMHLGMVTLSVPGAPGYVSAEWVRSKVRRRARLERGQVTIGVAARVEADVNEAQANLDLSDPKTLALVEDALKQAIQTRMEEALASLKAQNLDAAGFGEVIHRQLPGVWRRLKPRWKEDGLQQISVVISVEAKLRRTGLSSKPKGVNDEDLRKGGR